MRLHFLFLSLAFGLVPALQADDAKISVVPQKASGVYNLNEPVVWDVKVTDDPQGSIKTAAYDLREAGSKIIGQGTLTFINEAATIEGSLGEPGTILAEVKTTPGEGQKAIRALGGAAVAYDQLKPSLPRPNDFDAFWEAKLAGLAAIPLHPVLTPEDSGAPGVDYWKITLDNINGTHVQGQLARPTGDKKLPGLLILQWAGVYPLQKKWVVDRAAHGWLTLNIMAHDLPIDQPKEFYEEQAKNELKDYTRIGDTDRDQSYFLRMFLGDLQAAKYLEQRPDWDGKTLAANGTSQGGMQSFAVTGLDSRITDMVVEVPAGCDNSGALVGRTPGWPFHLTNPNDPKQKQILQVMAYFDPVNFASRIKAPALVAVGLIDETAPPSGIFTAFNQLQGPKEILVMARSDHRGTGGSQAAYATHSTAWFDALARGGPAPVPKP